MAITLHTLNFGMNDNNKRTRHGRPSALTALDCTSYGVLEVEIACGFDPSLDIHPVIIELEKEWNDLWPLAYLALNSEIKTYGYAAEIPSHK